MTSLVELAKGVILKTGFRTAVLLFFSVAISSIANAQAVPTATQPLELSAFGAGTGNWTGLGGGRNLGITAGVDIAWKPFYGFYPAVEGRGTYPVDSGHVDSQKNALVGFRASRFYGRFHPYGDFLFGRGKIVYQNGGYPNPSGTLLYIDSVSNVFSYGGGLNLTLSDSFSLKADAQIQSYGTPVATSGHIYSKPVSIGIVYHFDFNHHIHYNADGQLRGYKAPPPPRPIPPPPPPSNTLPSNSETPPASPNSTTDTAPLNATDPASNSVAPASNATSGKPSPDTPASSAPQQLQ